MPPGPAAQEAMRASHKITREAEAACKRLFAEATDRLVAAGLIARNKAGAISVTTAGKNAPRTRIPYQWYPGKVEVEEKQLEVAEEV